MTGGAPPAPRPIATLRLGVPRRYFCEPLETEVSRLFEAFLDKLRRGGATLIEVDLSEAQPLNERAGIAITGFELRHEIPVYLRAHDLAFGLDALVAQIAGPDVRRMFALRADVTEAMYRVALDTDRPALQRLYADCFANHQLAAVIFPTVPIPAAPIGDDVTTPMNGTLVPTFPTVARNTGPGSVAGLPGLTLPVGLTQSGLPIGIELDGPSGSDGELLATGLILERIADPLPVPSLP